MSERPAVRTVANVELMTVGTWPASTGPVTWTPDDIAAARAAFDDASYTLPVLKIGHIDPRFDGQPALGRIANARLSDDKMTLIADVVGVPTWLADLMDGTAAFPSRSIEGQFDFKTAAGVKHDFAITALSLLGVQAPAVSTLADVAALYDLDPAVVAAATPAAKEDEAMPERGNVEVAASVSMDSVRNAFYKAPVPTPYSWVREVYTDSLIVDDDEGNLFKLPWSEKGASEVEFGTPTRVTVEYQDAPATEAVAASKGAMRAFVAAHKEAVPAAPAATQTPEPETPAGPTEEGTGMAIELNDDQAKALRKRLGLAEDASDEQVAAALVAEPAPSTEDHGTSHTPPAGTVTIDAQVLEDLQRGVAAGRAANERLQRGDRDATVQAAVEDGRIPRARIDHWKQAWDKDPEGVKQTLASMPKGLVPTTLAGYAGDPSEEDIDAEFAHLFPPSQNGASS